MSEIKKPVIYDTEAWYIEDADGNVVCDIDAEGLPSDEFHFIGNEIAIAINEHADLKAKLADANRGAQVNALVNESLAKKLKLAVEALEYIANSYAGDARRISMETLKQIRGKVKEEKHPCAKCGTLRTKSEGGTVFTVCDECWDKR